jgi:hypothetical protein
MSNITYYPDTPLSTELFDDVDDIVFQPPNIQRSTPKHLGKMHNRNPFGNKSRSLPAGRKKRKRTRKKRRRKKRRATGRSGKKNTRKKTATVHKFEIIKRNPLTIKIFEKQGKKWVLKETHVAQKGGTHKLRQAEMSYVKYQVLHNDTPMKTAISEWRKQVKQARAKKKLDDLINTQLQKNPQEGGRRKTRRRKTRRRKKTRRQIGCNN